MTQIDGFYKAFLKKYMLNNEDLCRQHGVPIDIIQKGKTLKMGDLLDLFVPFFAVADLFRAMKASLPAPLPAIMDVILWDGPHEHTTLEKKFNTQIAYTHQDLGKAHVFSPAEELNPLYGLFRDYPNQLSYTWYSNTKTVLDNLTSFAHVLFLDEPIRSILKSFSEKPAEYELLPLPEIPPTAFTFINDTLIFNELPVTLAYIQQDKLAVNDYGKAATSSLNKMLKFCNSVEFYGASADKNVATLRTRLVTQLLLMMVGKEQDRYVNPAEFIKKTFEFYQKNYATNSFLLFHLKGLQKIGKELPVTRTLFDFLRNLPLMQWVSAENVVKSALYKGLILNIFDYSEAVNYVYLEYNGQYGKDKKYITLDTYQPFIVEPLIRGSLFLYAAFGLVDIAYDEPTHALAEKFSSAYISPYDGLRYVRLTPFGAYVCGLSQQFEAPVAENNDVLLDEDNLFLSYRGDNRTLQSVLDKIGKRAGGNKNLYKIDYESLLGDCNTEKEIESKINLFKQLLSHNPPKLWKDFFAKLQQQSFHLNSQQDKYKVFQLPENKELIRMFAGDDFLKKHVIKADMYYVLIPKENIAKVKTYLKKFGFLVDFRV
ncbi:MAG: hypothetical protein V4714_06130 [Bacteroidota bacterium]